MENRHAIVDTQIGEVTLVAADLDLVGLYYPANRIPVKTQYLVEGLFEEGKV